MKACLDFVSRTFRTQLCFVLVILVTTRALALDGPNVCMAEQKYNITKRIKYRAPMAVRTYEWCFSVPPRCSRWTTELRDLTRLETEERTAEVAVCCPGYKMTDISCVPICPNGKTGLGCSEDCPPKKWGPNCVNECPSCKGHGTCSPVTGKCRCQDGWQGESCEVIITTTMSTSLLEDLLASTNNVSTTANAPPMVITPRNETSLVFVTTNRSTTSTNQPTSSTLANFEYPSNKTDSSLKLFGLNNKTTTIKHFNNSLTSTLKIQKLITSTQKATEYIVTERTPLKTSQSNNSISTISPIQATSVTTSSMPTTESKIITKPTTTTTLSYSPEVITVPVLTTIEIKPEVTTTYKPEITNVAHPTTIKFKPKEIWIRPAQKGEHSSLETKAMHNQEQTHLIHRIVPRKELTSTITTPKTIVVSIIPTSISYTTFKKIAFTTSPYFSFPNSVISVFQNKPTGQKFTKSIMNTTYNSTPEVKQVTSKPAYSHRMYSSTTTDFSKNSLKIPIRFTNMTTKSVSPSTIKSIVSKNHTNSMFSDAIKQINSNSSINLTIPTIITNVTKSGIKVLSNTFNSSENILNKSSRMVTPTVTTESNRNTKNNIKQIDTTTKSEVTKMKITDTTVKTTRTLQNKATEKYNTKINVEVNPNISTNTTAQPSDEETFHILTEPEHITAVMGENGTEKPSLDLVSVITIAGGVMMAVITVAVVIVMIERCKRPRYEEVRKISDIRMQVMIDNNDMPPPYVRSIFHTPLPDPPTSDKCHYQPISTLDRNLKQFMRPVVVQAISPVMLENFRDILECHYDHLPRRTQHFETLPTRTTRSSLAPSMNDTKELRHQRAVSVAESTIEALKCEAKFDVIDSTTAEPLYAEIPCWRPPSEHAIEVVTVNGEAVTEL